MQIKLRNKTDLISHLDRPVWPAGTNMNLFHEKCMVRNKVASENKLENDINFS